MMSTLTITCKLAVADEWHLIDDYLHHPSAMLDYYLHNPTLHCCDFQGGFFIDIDGVAWSDEGTVDEFWMTLSWFVALNDLWSGAGEAKAWPWEESQLTLTSDGDRLILEDMHPSGRIVAPRIIVPLRQFTEQMLVEGKKFVAFLGSMEQLIEQGLRRGVSPEVQQQYQIILDHLPDDGTALLQDLERKLSG